MLAMAWAWLLQHTGSPLPETRGELLQSPRHTVDNKTEAPDVWVSCTLLSHREVCSSLSAISCLLTPCSSLFRCVPWLPVAYPQRVQEQHTGACLLNSSTPESIFLLFSPKQKNLSGWKKS
uniref:Uncharacterized protein n=1 Tax=Molossus molossus TaxID=27622 RepID=A0A7J8C8Y6_MOLMO|nr:hypothetical protein HJG59_009977 [Molossus molossus]